MHTVVTTPCGWPMTLTRLVTVLKTPLCIMLLTVVYYEMGCTCTLPPTGLIVRLPPCLCRRYHDIVYKLSLPLRVKFDTFETASAICTDVRGQSPRSEPEDKVCRYTECRGVGFLALFKVRMRKRCIPRKL